MRRMIVAAALGLMMIPVVGFAAPESIKDVMKTAHGKNAPLVVKVATEAKAKKWDDAAKDAATLKENADAMAGFKPKKGNEDSWKKQTMIYSENMDALVKATEKKDPKAVAAAVDTIGKSCKACHGPHK